MPLKVLVFEDANGRVWLPYNEPSWIAQRHGDAASVADVTARLAGVLAALAKAATA